MNKRNLFRRIMAMGLCMMLLAGAGVSAQAAGRVQNEDYYRAVFDAEYYYENNQDLQTAVGMDPEALFSHFVNHGIREGRSGDGSFSLRAYIQNNKDLMEVFGENYDSYLRHYVDTGRTEGRKAMFEEQTGILGSYTCTYDPGEQRAVNVELAAERINGRLLQPGDEFSFSGAILSRTYDNGYVLGPSFAGGREVLSVGGGICQVSSSLYVAMIRSVLSSTERYTHSLPVDYVPVGLDATIVENAKDLKFKNTFSSPLLITATAEDGVLTVSLSLEKASGATEKAATDAQSF